MSSRVDGPESGSLHLRLAQFGDVAQPPPPPAGWYRAPAPGRAPPNTLVIGLVLAVVVVILAVSVIAFSLAGSSTFFPLGFAPFLCVPFLFVIIFIIIALSTASGRRTIPPPPPIQQPIVPAGRQGPVALGCPNCSGPPNDVDRVCRTDR